MNRIPLLVTMTSVLRLARPFVPGTRAVAMFLFLAVGLSGCAGVRAVNTASPSSIRGGLQIGDQITVTTRDN
jgi:hypothetical protein